MNNKSEILTIEFNHNFHSPELYKNKRSIASSLQRMNHDYDRLFGKIYSDVEINFSPNQITSITAKDIDQRINKTIKSNTNIATEITQLLIDVKALDDAELADWVNEHTGQIPPDSVKNSRIKRFTNAFHSIFETKRFKGVENKANRKVVNFEEKGRIMSIDQLSSGEKQIVFRGGFLLKDKKSNEGAYVLVDEPEISLHPKWQLEILPFLKKLFTNENGTQTSQIIIATHSPFIIHNTNRKNDKVIVLQKNAMGRIEVASNPEFYAWRPKEIVKEAFNIDFEMGQYEKVVFVEGETDEKYYNKALEVYGYEKNKIHIEWIGRNVEKGKSENTGDKALNSALTFFLANKFILKSPE